MEVIAFIFIVLSFAALIFMVVGLINPKWIKQSKNHAVWTRKQVAQYLGIGALVCLIIGVVALPKVGTTTTAQPEQVAASEPLPYVDVEHEILTDDRNANIVRKVEVLLEKRISKQLLTDLANEIKNDEPEQFERTFIMYQIAGEKTVAAWATTHFDPDLKIKFIGLDADQFKKLLAKDTTVEGEKIGEWVSTVFGTGVVNVIYKNNGNYYENLYFYDGTSPPEPRLLKLENDLFSYADTDEKWSFKVNEAGDLEYWGENGNSTTARKKSDFL